MANAVMGDCIETAMRDSAFGLVRDESGDCSVNLFMVNEAEAGASYALASNADQATIKVCLCELYEVLETMLTLVARAEIPHHRLRRWYNRSRPI